MAFPVIGGTQVSGYNIDNSLRFNDDDTAYLNRTRSSQSNTTGTFSVWTKMGNVNVDNVLFGGATDVNNRSYIYFSDLDGFVGIFSRTSGSADIAYNSNAKFRDPSAWYHVVVAIDTTQGTAGNRFKMYINGTQYTDWGTATAPSQNASLPILNQSAQTVGGGFGASAISSMAEGYLADAYYIDGQQLAPTDFGEFNDNGVWIPKNYTGSYGTNGFKLEFKQLGTAADATSIGADTSGNDNHFSQTNVTPALDRTVDTPTNNFCTMNPIAADPDTTLADGNLQWTSGGDGGVVGTMAVSNGKWYWECKGVDVGADSQLGIWQTSKDTGYPLNQYVGTGESWGYVTFSGKNIHSDSQSGAITAVSDNDIMMFALDMDNYKLWFGINGTWTQSGNPATGDNANHTGITDEFMTPAIASFSGTSGYDWRFNFGNPIVSISSGNSDANGYGNFEYAVPSGYYSLCTKNLAQYG